MDNTPNCWELSLLQHLDELGMEITTGALSLYPMALLAIMAALQLADNIKISVDETVTDAL